MIRIFNAVTGPSGAGKSAFCKQQPDWEHHLYNLDDWARKLGEVDSPAVRESAWTILLQRLADDMSKGYSPITLDHVFESRTIDEVVTPAKALDYRVCLWVVCPDDPQICVERVKKRKDEGGHGRSARTIMELYESALHVASEISIEVQPAPTWVRKHFLGEAR